MLSNTECSYSYLIILVRKKQIDTSGIMSKHTILTQSEDLLCNKYLNYLNILGKLESLLARFLKIAFLYITKSLYLYPSILLHTHE